MKDSEMPAVIEYGDPSWDFCVETIDREGVPPWRQRYYRTEAEARGTFRDLQLGEDRQRLVWLSMRDAGGWLYLDETLDAIRPHGRPTALRSSNEATMTARLA